MKRYRMRVRPLTAVHVGTGKTIDPLEYTLVSNARGETIFLRYYPEKVVQGLSPTERTEFRRLTDGRDVVALRVFLGERAGINSAWYTAAVTSAFRGQVEQKKSDFSNSLEVEAAYRAPGQLGLVIPGSSIKGALRTAVVSERARLSPAPKVLEERARDVRRFDTSFQEAVLSFSRPNDDPFRMLAAEDCPFPPRGTQLVGRLFQYKPFRRDGSPFESIAIHAELIRGDLLGGTETPECHLLFDQDLPAFKAPARGALRFKEGRRVIDKPISMEEIVKSTDEFYLNAFNHEYNTFFLEAGEPSVYSAGKKLADRIDKLMRSGEHLFRIGRWSHAESVTVEKYRRPGSRRGYGKTRTLLEYEDGHYPMGWCTFALEAD